MRPKVSHMRRSSQPAGPGAARVSKRALPGTIDCELLQPEIVQQMVADGKLREVKNPARVMRFIASTERVDRMGDIVRQNYDLESYRKNPVVLWDHDYGSPLGRSVGEVVVSEDPTYGPHLQIYVEFMEGPDVEPIFKAYVDKFLKGGSIGFTPLSIDDVPDEVRRSELGLGPSGVVYERAELNEFSLCAIPANPDALVTALRSVGSTKFAKGSTWTLLSKGVPLPRVETQLVVRALSSAEKLPAERRTEVESAAKKLLEGDRSGLAVLRTIGRRASPVSRRPADRLEARARALATAAAGISLQSIVACSLPPALRRDLESLVGASGDLAVACRERSVSREDVGVTLQFTRQTAPELVAALRRCESPAAREAALSILKSVREIAVVTKQLFSDVKSPAEGKSPRGGDERAASLVRSVHSALSEIDVDDPSTVQAGISSAMFSLGRLAESFGVELGSESGGDSRREEPEPSEGADRPPGDPSRASPRPAIGTSGSPGFRSSRLQVAKRALRGATEPEPDAFLEELLGLGQDIERESDAKS